MNKLELGKKRLTVIVVVILLLAAAGGFVYQMRANERLRQENQRLQNPQEAAKAEADKLKDEVGGIIELPNESPTIATVVDVDKLKSQAFFANAQNGDKVLLFPQAKRAVLYRPSTRKIIEVAPINIGDSGNTQGAPTEQPAQ